MKNMKVRAKMFTGFIIVTAIGIILGMVGIASILMIKNRSEEIVSLQNTSSGVIGVLNAHYTWRHSLTEAVLTGGEFTGSLDPNTCRLGQWLGSEEAKGITDTVALDLLRRIESPHHFIHTEARGTVEYIKAGSLQAAKDNLVEAILPRTQEVISLLTEVEERFTGLIEECNKGILALENLFIFIIIGLIVVAIIISILLAFYISNMISKPLMPLYTFMHKAGTTGDITLRPEDVETISKFARNKDEIGQTIGASAAFLQHVTNISRELETVASGDLTTEIEVLSPSDEMGNSLKKMLANLNTMFSEIQVSTNQVSTGSKQIADGAQTLAQGSTEQAAAVEQLSSSISEIAQKTKTNADMAGKAASLANTIKDNAEKGSSQMAQMMDAVKEINQASQNINKVISVIDNIAFQTNILALNAAVEAARAGQHGKGFAVVAEEVRSLASKSAEAANETGTLIANSMEKAELGARIADETAASLVEIVSGINESTQLVSEIAKSSEEQSAGISQVNKGIDQVAQVVQQNSATAEESAAASEEMSGQSDILQQLIAQFKLKEGSGTLTGNAARSMGRKGLSPKKIIDMPEASSFGGGDFGKY